MDLTTAIRLHKGTRVVHRTYGVGVWHGLDSSDAATGWVDFDRQAPTQVPVASVEVD